MGTTEFQPVLLTCTQRFRLGTMFGCDKYNIKPDMVSLAKVNLMFFTFVFDFQALSSAYMPIGAVLVSPEVSDVIHSQSNKLSSFSHGFTYSGHPSALGVGAYFGAQCEKNGMLVRVAGDNVMMSPPLIMTPEEVDEVP
ncbi:hypothetical protein K1719_028162 [Acacia pycnantha]|nr:hypothetical protein K1719_028162 [Acacia pycnantha]